MSDVLEMCFDELDDVQFCDNTPAEATQAKNEVKEIMRRLEQRLTKHAPDEAKCPHCGEPLAAAALHEFCYPPASPRGQRKPLGGRSAKKGR